MNEALKSHLENNPKIETVYFNEKGEWQFHEHKGYNQPVSRNEILDQPKKAVKVKAAKVADETEDVINQQ